MKPKTLILIVAAVGCGLAASYMTSRLLADRNNQQVEEEKVPVVVAKQKIAMGTLVKNPEQFFEVREFNASQAPKKALTKLEDLKDKRLNKPLSAEQFVSSDDFLDGKSGDLSAALPAGMRAVAIRTNMEKSAGSFVLANSRVDLMLTVKKADHDSWSRIFMQNILVLAVDTFRVRDPEKDHHIPSVITLAATPEEAEKIMMAQAMGEISMVLRPFGEEQPVHTRGATPLIVARAKGTDSSGVDKGDGPESSVPRGLEKLDFPETKPSTKPADQPADPTPTPPRTHTLVIYNGESMSRHTTLIDLNGQPINQEIDRQEVTPRPEKSSPSRGPAKPDKAPPASEPAPGNK